jgi:hypothetical protein
VPEMANLNAREVPHAEAIEGRLRHWQIAPDQ